MLQKRKAHTVKNKAGTYYLHAYASEYSYNRYFFKHLSTYVNRVQYTVVLEGCLVYQIYQVQYLHSHKGLKNNKIIKELWQANLPESIKYDFLKSYGKFKMYFTFAAYTGEHVSYKIIK